jgi:hypothetical protein
MTELEAEVSSHQNRSLFASFLADGIVKGWYNTTTKSSSCGKVGLIHGKKRAMNRSWPSIDKQR